MSQALPKTPEGLRGFIRQTLADDGLDFYLLSRGDVVSILGITPITLDRWALRGLIPSPKKLNGRNVWERAPLIKALRENMTDRIPQAAIDRLNKGREKRHAK